MVGNDKLAPDRYKVKALKISRFALRRNHFGVFGVMGYYRRHIENYSQRAFALTEFTKKSKPDEFQMNDVELAAFDDLRKALISLPVLQPPNLNVPLILKAGCSQFCCGAVLPRQNLLGREHPIAYFAKKLLPRVTNCSTVEKECLAVLLNFER